MNKVQDHCECYEKNAVLLLGAEHCAYILYVVILLLELSWVYFYIIMSIFSFEGGGSGSHYMEASFWRRLWTCCQTEY